MLEAFEYEKQQLLNTPSQKKGVSKKFKVIAAINVLVVCYIAYAAFGSSLS